jgi:uncharacterized protein YbjT (DUF2867 family)
MALTVTVFGANGDQGEAQMRQLLAAGHHAIAAMRDPAQARPGWTAMAADYRDPASLRRACAGSDVVFLTLPSTSFQPADVVAAAADAVAAAAHDSGVGLIVFNTSMNVGSKARGFAAQDARFAIREKLFAGPVPCIAIQPVIYLDNLLRAWALPDIQRDGVIRYPHHAGLEVCWISEDDVARLMIAACFRPDLAGRRFNVGGRDALCGPDLARRIGAAIGRPLRFETLPVDQFADRMAAVFGGGEALDRDTLVASLSRIYDWYNSSPVRPFYVDMGPVLAELPIALESVEQWALRQPALCSHSSRSGLDPETSAG